MKRSWMGGALALVTVAAIAVGCGGGGGGGSASHRVTVVVPTLDASPAIYAVLLNDSAGRLVSSTAVTSPGSQVVRVPRAGSVTFAAAVGSTDFHWTTVVDPPEGATLHFANRLPTPTPTPGPGFQTWNVTVTAVASATQYFVYGPCGYSTSPNAASPVSVTTEFCQNVTSSRIFVVANGSGGDPIAWHETASLPATPGGTTDLSVTLDQTDILQTTAAFQNLPAGTQGVGAYFESTDPSYVERFYRPAGYCNSLVNPGQSVAGCSFRMPAFQGVFTTENVTGNQGFILRQRALDASPGSVAFDLQGLDLPSYPSFDAPTATFHWGMPMFGTGQTLHMRLTDQAALPQEVEVTVALPAGVETYVLPQVPSEFLPSDALGEFSAQGGSVAPDVASIASYRDFVEHFDDDPVNGFLSQEGVFLLAQFPFS